MYVVYRISTIFGLLNPAGTIEYFRGIYNGIVIYTDYKQYAAKFNTVDNAIEYFSEINLESGYAYTVMNENDYTDTYPMKFLNGN